MNSPGSEKDRSRYFQSIARYFFEQRGAPFFLTPKEIDVLEKWSNAGIPLRIILDGIKQSVENRRKFPNRRNRSLSLEYCNHSVQTVFQQYKEKKIGQRRKSEQPNKKVSLVDEEIKKFLKEPLEGMEELREIFIKVQDELNKGNFDEDMLESADNEIERILLKVGSKKERIHILDAVRLEYPAKDQEEISEIFQVKWIKHLRRKHRIPYISLFYY